MEVLGQPPIHGTFQRKDSFTTSEAKVSFKYRTGVGAKIANFLGRLSRDVKLEVRDEGGKHVIHVSRKEAQKIIGADKRRAGERIGEQFRRVLHAKIGESLKQQGDASPSEARAFYERAANYGDAEAQYRLGQMYENGGEGVEKSQEKAESFYWRAAKQGHAGAQFRLGLCMDRQAARRQEAVKWYEKAADQGHAEAQYTLGRMYESGDVVLKSWSAAFQWYEKAADQGHADAQYAMGRMYGKLGTVGEKPALTYYQWAAAQEHAEALFTLGDFYDEGKNGVPKDPKMAFEKYTDAAKHGHAYSQYLLGHKYNYGQGVKQDRAEAIEWYKKAAEQGHERSKFDLGMIYLESDEHREEAKRLLAEVAASSEDPEILYELGCMYYEGTKVPQDQSLGEKLLIKASQRYSWDAKRYLDKLKGKDRAS